MFQFKFEGVDALLTKFNTLEETTKEIGPKDIPEEFVTWQVDDMRRKYPEVATKSTGNEHASHTSIWPRGRTYQAGKHKDDFRSGTGNRNRKGPRTYGAVLRPTVSRTILRPELLESLYDRMKKMVSEKFSWP